MKTAKEMFEELGYVQHTTREYEIIYNMDNLTYIDDYRYISFYKNKKKIEFGTNENDCFLLTTQELKAINQQCKELGWINE